MSADILPQYGDIAMFTSASQIGPSGISIGTGSIIPASAGGTGVDNNGFLLTFDENINFLGGFDITFNSSATTNLNLPSSGTIATTAEISGANVPYYTMYGGL